MYLMHMSNLSVYLSCVSIYLFELSSYILDRSGIVKEKQFCETSSNNGSCTAENEASVRDFLQIWKVQR